MLPHNICASVALRNCKRLRMPASIASCNIARSPSHRYWVRSKVKSRSAVALHAAQLPFACVPGMYMSAHPCGARLEHIDVSCEYDRHRSSWRIRDPRRLSSTEACECSRLRKALSRLSACQHCMHAHVHTQHDIDCACLLRSGAAKQLFGPLPRTCPRDT